MSSINLKKISPKKIYQKNPPVVRPAPAFGTIFASAPPAPPRCAQRKGAAPTTNATPTGYFTNFSNDSGRISSGSSSSSSSSSRRSSINVRKIPSKKPMMNKRIKHPISHVNFTPPPFCCTNGVPYFASGFSELLLLLILWPAFRELTEQNCSACFWDSLPPPFLFPDISVPFLALPFPVLVSLPSIGCPLWSLPFIWFWTGSCNPLL